MTLQNYWNWKAFVDTTHAEQGNATVTSNPGIFDMSGNNCNFGVNTYNYTMSTITTTNWALRTNLSIRVGVGDNEYSYNDYSLVNDVSDSIGNLLVTSNLGIRDGKLVTVITASGINNSDSDLEITEFGITKLLYTRPGSYDTATILLAIVKLNEAIVVPSHSGFNHTIEWVEV